MQQRDGAEKERRKEELFLLLHSPVPSLPSDAREGEGAENTFIKSITAVRVWVKG